MVSRTRSSTLWPVALAGAIALIQPAAAAPVWNTGPSGKPQVQASDKTKSKSAPKSASKPQSEAKPKPDPKAKTKPEAKTAPKTAAGGNKTVPMPVAWPSSTAVGGRAFAAPAAAALPAMQSAEPAQTSTTATSLAQTNAIPPAATTIITAAAIDVTAVKRAIELVRGSKQSEASELRKNISDPAAKKLVEWVILRSDDSGADFGRYIAFISANSNWPSIVTLRRKAEASAFQERPDSTRVETYFSQWPPLSAKGKFAYARAILLRGDRKTAETLVRETWRNDAFSQDVESKVYEAFGDILTRADHKARMDRRLYEKDDTEAGMRAAQRLGGNEVLIAKGRIAALGKGSPKAALDAVPAAARDDIGYKLARIQMYRRADQLADAMALIKTIPKPLDESHDHDEW